MRVVIDGRTFVGAEIVVELEVYFVLANNFGEFLMNGWDSSVEWNGPSSGQDPVKFETAADAEVELQTWQDDSMTVTVVEIKPDAPFIVFKSGGQH